MAGRRGKRILITISSDDEDDDCRESSGGEIEYEEEEEKENQLLINCVEVDDAEEADSSDSNYSCDEFESINGDADDVNCGDSSSEDDNEEEESDSGNGDTDDRASCNRVLFLQGKKELEKLSLKECKAYLRKNGLRISGTKTTCLQRIQEHGRIKDGNGEALYPRSSFIINCTGDVCKGDIVLFTQKVYARFDKVTRNGKFIGRRTIAGRVAKESYGAAKQQHTFTVEVLWSKGIKKLPPLAPLLVKGRNLYRLRTFRQTWKNETARSKVLEEKHRRGAEARQKMSRRKRSRTIDRGATHEKMSHCARSPHMNHSKIVKPVNKCRAAPTSTQMTAHNQKPQSVKNATQQKKIRSRASKSSLVYQKGPRSEGRASTVCSHTQIEASRNFDQLQPKFHMQTPHTGSPAFTVDSLGIRRNNMDSFGSAASIMLPHQIPHAMMGVAQRNGVYSGVFGGGSLEFEVMGANHQPVAQHNGVYPGAFGGGSLEFEAMRANQQPLLHSRRSSFFPPQVERYSPEVFFSCSTRGCRDFGSSYCVNFACSRCCCRTRLRCNVHH